MSEAERVPSFFLLVPGPWATAREVIELLTERGLDASEDGPAPGAVRVEIVESDQLGEAFTWGRFGTLPEDLIARVSACTGGALLEVGARFDHSAVTLSTLSHALRDAGGLAIRTESCGGAWTWEAWLSRVDAGDPWSLYECATLVVAEDDRTLFTCGMHAFELPEARVQTDDPAVALSWLDTFCVFQIAEQPVLGTGHTFRPDEDSPRRVLERWPDDQHHPNDGRHNPFGVWRFLEEGGGTPEPSKLILKFVPSLVSLLMRAEEISSAPLTQSQVEAIVDNGTVVAMDLADANALDRARGYSDIEPELAWAQWQVIHDTL